MYKLLRDGLLVLTVMLLGVCAVRAASVPPGFTESIIPGPFAGLWGKPVGTTFDAAGRQLVWERLGRIWIKGPTETNFSLLLSIEEEEGDEGLLGFAIDPDFQANGYIYLLYVVDRHHLLYFGTTNYNPNVSQEDEATIARLTRYTCVASNDFKTVDPASRLILIGDSKTNGFPVCGSTHTVGSLVFGVDGTLLVSCGDTASFSATDTGGAANGSYAPQALADGIIRPKENVGAYRAQLVDCLNGKVLRIDPATGDGLPSNPFYDATRPRAAKSRVWGLGFRNPFRMTLRPNSGSHNPADGNPGVLYVGEVSWDTKESLKVVTGPGQNFGWPLYEGLELTPPYAGGGGSYNVDVNNLDATNALCGGYFSFRQLLKQETTNAANFPPFNNPCNASFKIPTNIPQFLFKRPALDWDHFSVSTRTPTFDASGNATIANVGAGGSPVAGVQFQGNCSIGGAWYDGTAYPAQYQNKYFHADWGQEVIKMMSFDASNRPTTVSNFASNVGPVVCLVQHPFDGSLYYVLYNGDTGTVRKLSYTGNRTPEALASADQNYGPGPLTVQFSSAGSSDPDGQALTYSWNFGDGTAVSTLANPSHVFTSPGSTRTNYKVTLTVTDTGGLLASATLNIALNDTPPNVTITSPTNGALYSVVTNTPFALTASVTDAESGDSQLAYLWQTVLHHNDHDHVEGTSTNHVSSTAVEPIGCDGANIYYYRVILTVTDPRGLATTREVGLFPNCGTTDTPATITAIADQSTQLGVATGPVPFTIGDAQVAAANLQLSAGSSDPVLVPTNNVVFGGFGANRTVTVTPAPGLNGTSTITVKVNDGPNNTVETFLLTVGGSNTPPTISSIANQTVGEGTPATAACTVGDANTPLGSLTLSASSSNPALVPANNFAFGGSGSNRTVTAIPAPGQTGVVTIMVTVSDGALSASNSFTLTVTNLPPGARSATNTTAIAIVDASAGSPYPSVINVTGLGGTVTNVTLTLRSLSHEWGRDIDALLVGPGGQKLMFMSDAGTEATVTNGNLTFSASAASFLVQTGHVAAGTYKPTDYEPGDVMPAPAPAGPYATNLSVFNGQIANGAWSLYVVDDGSGDVGNIAGGWSLTVATASAGPQPPTITDIANQTTLTNTPVGPLAFTIGDMDTPIGSLTLSNASSNPTLVPTNNIVFGGSGASRTVTVTPVGGLAGTATISVFVSDGTNVASDTFLLTVQTAQPQTLSFTNAAGIAILDITSATPYPSTINVAGMNGTVSNVTVTLRSLSHEWGRDIDALLVGPGGQKVMFMSDAGTTPTATNANFTFSDSAASYLPALGSLVAGTYKPTDHTNLTPVADVMPAPAPAGPYATNLSAFAGQIANGTWSLYVFDDGSGETGSIAGGWSLTISTQPVATSNNPPTISAVSNQVTLVNTPTTAIPFTIGDGETAASNLVLTAFTSNAGLVPTNRIVFGGSGASRTVTVTPTSNQLGSAAISLNVSDGSLIASNSFSLTVNPALLTVTENSASRGYGLTNPVLTGSVIGLQAGDNITASFTSTANTNSPVGAYPITFAFSDPGSKLGNYVITTNNGTLTVTNASLAVTASSAGKVYGATLNPTAFGVTGLRNSDSVTSVTLTSAGSVSNAPVGSYSIVASGATGTGLANYSIGYSNGTLVVTQAVLVATADDQSRAYGQPNPVFTINYSGFVNGDGTNVLDELPVAGSSATNTSAPGNYVIAITGGGDNNYLLSTAPGTLTITAPGPVTITTVEFVEGVNLRIAGTGDANVSYRIQASSDLTEWTEIGTATADEVGAFEYVDDAAGGFTARFYRVSTP